MHPREPKLQMLCAAMVVIRGFHWAFKKRSRFLRLWQTGIAQVAR